MSMSTDVRIALVYQQAGGSEALRMALANAGVVVAAEARADVLDAAALLAADVDAVVVNLDAELEDLLDEVMERLDGLSQPVIYNDPEASSDLSGWDRARWLRHLSAKVRGGGSLVPPLPPGAEAVPVPASRAVEPAGPVATEAVTGTAAATDGLVPEPAAAPASVAERFEAQDIDLLFVSTEAGQVPTLAPEAGQEPMVDLDALFDSPPATADAEPPPETLLASSDADFDALFVAPAESDVTDQGKLALADLDALFAGDPTPAPAAPAARVAGEVESDIDLTALLADFSLDQIPSGNVSADPPPPVAPDWSLANPETDAADSAPQPAAGTADEDVAGLSDLTDLDALFADPAASTDTPQSEPVAGIEIDTLDLGTVELGLELEAIDVDMPAATGAQAPVAPVEDALAVAEFDFGFELEPITGEAAPATAAAALADPLDALFEPASAALGKQGEVSLPDLDRVFVLGGSIGGPEAMKAFLARLPAGVPAAFVIAQHMGGEFLQMMASQLDAATALSVRFPKPGERLRHGEVVVAPSDQRLAIDRSGHLELQPSTGDSPYSPSIDQLVTDAIERLGDRVTLILFSGMGSDGLEGARHLIARGGQVWVQERSTCVVASMIEGVRGEGLVRFEGGPVELADRVLEMLS
jgi:chemosensory pili system protein ChpB (putative protein-glutamate methylesterase)